MKRAPHRRVVDLPCSLCNAPPPSITEGAHDAEPKCQACRVATASCQIFHTRVYDRSKATDHLADVEEALDQLITIRNDLSKKPYNLMDFIERSRYSQVLNGIDALTKEIRRERTLLTRWEEAQFGGASIADDSDFIRKLLATQNTIHIEPQRDTISEGALAKRAQRRVVRYRYADSSWVAIKNWAAIWDAWVDGVTDWSPPGLDLWKEFRRQADLVRQMRP